MTTRTFTVTLCCYCQQQTGWYWQGHLICDDCWDEGEDAWNPDCAGYC